MNPTRRILLAFARTLACAAALGTGAALGAHTDLGREVMSSAQAAPRRSPAKRASLMKGTKIGAEPGNDLPTLWNESPTARDAFGRNFASGKVVSGATAHRLVLFTFDDGPSRDTTPRLLDYLDAAGIRAVFFLTASRMRDDSDRGRENREIAREIVRRGHTVGNHTLDHAQLPILGDIRIRQQVLDAEQIFKEVFGERTWLFRPPGGARSTRVDRILTQLGYTSVLWNLGTGDFQVRTPEEVFGTWKRVYDRRVRDEGERGGIVLMHDIHEWSVEAFPMIVEELRQRNCHHLAAEEELFDIVDGPEFFFSALGVDTPGTVAPPAAPAPGILEERQRKLREETRQRCEALAMR